MAPALIAVPILAASMTSGVTDQEARADRTVPAAERLAPKFTIGGRAAGLYPGARRLLHVRVHNPLRTPIVVTRLRVASIRGDRDCPGTSIRVRPFRGRRLVLPRRIMAIPLKVRMRRNAPDGCQGTRFRLTFRGEASRR